MLVAEFLHEGWHPNLVEQLLGSCQPAAGGSFRVDLLTSSFAQLRQQLQQRQQDAGASAASPCGAMADADVAAALAASATFFTEPWFGMEAVAMQLPGSLCACWESADVAPDLALPPRNAYIPTDFRLKGAAAAQQLPGGAAAAEGAIVDVRGSADSSLASLAEAAGGCARVHACVCL